MAVDTKNLHPIVKDLMEKFITEAKAKGINLMITQAYRSKAEQDALYAQGRTTKGKIVTNARGGYSNHNYGLAFDFVPLVGNKAVWDSHSPLWGKLGEIGESLGLSWGGRWRPFVDLPHLEKTFNLSVAELAKGKRPPNVAKVSNPEELKGLTEKQLIRTKVGIYKIV